MNRHSSTTDLRKTAYFYAGFALAEVLILVLMGGDTNAGSLSIVVLSGMICALASVRNNVIETITDTTFKTLLLFFAVLILMILMSLTNIVGNGGRKFHLILQNYSNQTLDKSRTLIEGVKFLGIACFFLIGVSTRRYEVLLLRTVNYAGTVLALLSIMVFLTLPHSNMRLGSKTQFLDRLTGPFSSANTAGTFFGAIFLIGVGLLIYDISQSLKKFGRYPGFEKLLYSNLVNILAVFNVGFAVLLTGSRSAITTTALAACGLIVLEGGRRKWQSKAILKSLAIFMFFAFGAVITIGGGTAMERFGLVSSDSVIRAHIYQTHANPIAHSWLFGKGLGTFEIVNRQLLYINKQWYGDLWSVRAMHNIYLQWIEEGGALLALPMFASISLILFVIIRAVFKNEKRTASLPIITALSCAILLHGVTDFALEDFWIATFWALLLGGGYSAGLSSRNSRSDKLSRFASY